MNSIVSETTLKAIEFGILGLLVSLGIACLAMFAWRWQAVGNVRASARPCLEKLAHALSGDLAAIAAPAGSVSGESAAADRLVRIGIGNSHLCPDALDKLLEMQETRERESLERGCQLLGTVGANAPFLGLTGTVIGILSAFRRMASEGGGGVEVMSAISGALIATAAGLIVAIPAVVLYNLLKSRIKRTMNTLSEIRGLLMARSLQSVAKEVF
ncbi:MAG: MotA/TolQ/ExbB proton channel family protein [Fibrobacterota bacterium]|nr:MotA/TolQ/ExbB proton channel family protein [Fibrobacterota bacterium]